MPDVTLRSQNRLPPLGADALLVWPRGGNSGDMLILDACQRYLSDRGIQVWTSDGSIEQAVLDGDDAYLGDLFATYRGMLVFPGGGNIGIYPDNGHIRSTLIACLRPSHHCLVFPQSALAPEESLVHPRVSVWCRDAVSHRILQESGTRVELVPDVALYLDNRIEKRPDGAGIFFIRRVAGREQEYLEHGIGAGLYGEDLTYRTPLPGILSALAPFETVISDRLHGGLIALMLRKKVVLLPVGYHKTKSFFDTWLRDNASVAFVGCAEELDQAISGLRPQATDFSELFRRHADPALQRFLFSC